MNEMLDTMGSVPAQFVDVKGEQKAIIDGMNSVDVMYASFIPETMEDKKKLVNATSGQGESLIDNTKKPIALVDVLVTAVTITKDNGEIDVCPRTSLITADGKVYTATSWGLYRAIQKINMVYGGLHFSEEEPLMIQAHRIKTKKGQTINLEIL